MSRYLGATPFRDVLAHSIAADPTVRAAADALDNVLDAATRAVPDVLVYAQLARDSGFENPVAMLGPMERLAALSGGVRALPEQVLDLLAWQLHVEGYEAAVSVQAKRELVQMSLLLPAEVRQWFEYGGRPYFFRIRLDVTGAAFGPESSQDAFRLIHDHKNVRSWLDRLETHSTHTLVEHVGVGLVGRTVSRCRLRFPPCAAPRLVVRTGLGLSGITGGRLMAWSPPPRPVASARRAALGIAAITSARVGAARAPE